LDRGLLGKQEKKKSKDYTAFRRESARARVCMCRFSIYGMHESMNGKNAKACNKSI